MAKTRKAATTARKTRKGKLSPALAAWNKKVMTLYKTMKAKNPKTRLGDAMKAAKRAK